MHHQAKNSFFTSNFLRVNKDDIKDNMKDGFDIYKAFILHLVKDEDTDANRPLPPPPQSHTTQTKKQVRIRRDLMPVPVREKSIRIKKPNNILKDN